MTTDQMTTDQMTPSDALEIVASNRQLYGKSQGAREASEYLLTLSIELFKQGNDDKSATSIRDIAKVIRETMAKERFTQWKERDKVAEDAAIELLTGSAK